MLSYDPIYPAELQTSENAWGLWKLGIGKDGEICKKQVKLNGLSPDPTDPTTLTSFKHACEQRDILAKQMLEPAVEAFLKATPSASRCGLIWLIQPGYVVMDYDNLNANPQYRSLYLANPTWIERSSRGDGVHQVFFHKDKPSGVVTKVVDGIDARGSGTFLYTTGNCNPSQPTINELTPFFEDAISTRSQQIAELRASRLSLNSLYGEDVTDEYLLAKFLEDPEAVRLSSDPQVVLKSEVMGLFVNRLSRYSADIDQMVRVFCGFPCARQENISEQKRNRKDITDVASLFHLHFDYMSEKCLLDLPMVKFNLTMGQEETHLLPPEEDEQTTRLVMPPLPPNMQIIAKALDSVSEVAKDVAHPAVIQFVRMMADNRLLAETVFLDSKSRLRFSSQPSRAIVHFMTLANSGRGKSRSYRRIREFCRLLNAQYASDGTLCLLPASPIRDMGKGMQGAQRIAASLDLMEKQSACIALTDEADANFASVSDPGGSKAFLKEFTENVNSPGASTEADKTAGSQKRIELRDLVAQLSYLSTTKAMKPILMQHLGDGLLARLVLWISNEPAITSDSWDGSIHYVDVEERIDIAEAAKLCARYKQVPASTVTFSKELLHNTSIIRRLLSLNDAVGKDQDIEEDAYNRYSLYAQYLSAIYAWSENPEMPTHTEASLLWGISVIEYARESSANFFKDINTTVDASGFNERLARSSSIYADKYSSCINMFYTEGTDLGLLRKELREYRRLSQKVDEKIAERVLTVGMFTQYSTKFFKLSRTEVTAKIKTAALRELALDGIIELRSEGGIVLNPPPAELPATTEIRRLNTLAVHPEQ
jgi:hypothetical protein